MFGKSLMALTGSAAILISGTAFAAAGGGNGGSHGNAGGMAAPSGSMSAPMGGMPTAPSTTLSRPTTTTTTSTDTTVNSNGSAALQHSQGPAHASPNGIAHASPNSVLARGSVSSTTLPGLATGLTVNNSTGTSIGTVSQVITGSDGSIRAVVVTSPTGQTFRLPPSTLSISGGVVTTTSTSVGG